jgi:hypothetical protein
MERAMTVTAGTVATNPECDPAGLIRQITDEENQPGEEDHDERIENAVLLNCHVGRRGGCANRFGRGELRGLGKLAASGR